MCKHSWNNDFLFQSFSKASVKRINESCASRLIDIERAKLPEVSLHIQREREDEKRSNECFLECSRFFIDYLIKKGESRLRTDTLSKSVIPTMTRLAVAIIDRCTWKFNERTLEQYRMQKRNTVLRRVRNIMDEAIYEKKIGNGLSAIILKHFPDLEDGNGEEKNIEEKSKKRKETRFRKCPMPNCNGFLSTRWKCMICEANICNECNDPIETSTDEEEKKKKHKCDKEKRKLMTLIKEDTKPCPKCGEFITKISGCDQMWCICCHTAFDWKTMMIQERVHNPHYFEYLHRVARQQNEGEDVPRGVLIGHEMKGECPGQNLNLNRVSSLHNERLTELYRFSVHLEEVEIPKMREKVRKINLSLYNNNKEFLLSDKDEKQWTSNIKRHNKKRVYTNEFIDLLTMLIDTTKSICANSIIKKNSDLISVECDTLIDYVNETFSSICGKYNIRKREIEQRRNIYESPSYHISYL
jgi:hypothetical protein